MGVNARHPVNASLGILLLNYEFPPLGGGAANATQFMARSLAERGHRPVVVTSGLREEHSRTEEDGVVVHRLRTGRSSPDRSSMADMCRYVLAAGRHAPRIAREARCTAAIAFFTIPSGLVARWLNLRLGLPYLISLRGSDVPGHDVTLDRMHRLTRPLRRSVLAHALGIVANSEGLAATARAADPFPVHIVPNGVDRQLFHPPLPTEPRPETARFRLLFVGRVHREKNLAVVLQQMAALPALIRATIDLQVAGDGAQRPELEALAGRLGLTSQVQWLGWQQKSALPAIYRQADAVVNPSLYEGMPNVALEAMATGLPVVASDVPGNRSVVLPGKTGVLFPLDQPDLLGAALCRLATDRAWAKSLGRAGRERTETEFSWSKVAESYLELLDPVISR